MSMSLEVWAYSPSDSCLGWRVSGSACRAQLSLVCRSAAQQSASHIRHLGKDWQQADSAFTVGRTVGRSVSAIF